MALALKFGRDSQGFNNYAPRPSINKWSASLTNGNATSVTVPSTADYWTVNFRYQPGTTVWVDVTGATAAIPAGNTLQSTTSEMNPSSLILPADANISMITGNDSADVNVVMWEGAGD